MTTTADTPVAVPEVAVITVTPVRFEATEAAVTHPLVLTVALTIALDVQVTLTTAPVASFATSLIVLPCST